MEVINSLTNILYRVAGKPLLNVKEVLRKDGKIIDDLSVGISIQEIVNVISFIAMMEEFNYPIIQLARVMVEETCVLKHM